MQQQTAEDVMNTDVLVVEESLPVGDLAALLADNEISGAPVVGDNGQVVGVVSLYDLARAAAQSSNVAPERSDPGYYLRDWEEHYNPEDIKALRIVDTEATVGDLMSPVVRSVPLSTPVAKCAREMLRFHSHRLLVTEGEELKGIVTSFDLLRLVAGAG